MTTVWIVQEGDFCTSFTFAARNNKSVLPVFITMSDSDVIDAMVFMCQEYTVLSVSQSIRIRQRSRRIHRNGTIDIEREYYDRQQIRGDTHNRG